MSPAGPALPVGGARATPGARWPLMRRSIFMVLVPALFITAALINGYAALHCTRTTGACVLERGSVAFVVREEFPVDALRGATIEPGGLTGGRDVWVRQGLEMYRLPNGGLWDERARLRVSAQITGFVADRTQPELHVVVDARGLFVAGAVVLGALVALLAELRARRQDQQQRGVVATAGGVE